MLVFASTLPDTQLSTEDPGKNRHGLNNDMPGFVLVVLAGVLGGLALLLGLLYAYIYCTKIRPRHRPLPDDRINYYERDACTQYGSAQNEKDQPERVPIKTHPFFVLSYLSKLRAGDTNHTNQMPSTSSKRY